MNITIIKEKVIGCIIDGESVSTIWRYRGAREYDSERTAVDIIRAKYLEDLLKVVLKRLPSKAAVIQALSCHTTKGPSV